MAATAQVDSKFRTHVEDRKPLAWAYARELYQITTVMLEALESAREFQFVMSEPLDLVECIECALESVNGVGEENLEGLRFVLRAALQAVDSTERRAARGRQKEQAEA